MNLLLLLVLGMLWGSSYLFIKVVVAEIPVLTLVALRLLLAAILMVLLVIGTRRAMPRDRKLWGAYAFMGFFSGTLPYVLISWGEQHISSGLAAMLQATMPLFTVVLAHFLARDEPMSRIRVLGVAIGFIGVALLMVPDLRSGLQAGLFGQLAVVASSVSYAGATIFARNRLRGQPPLVSSMGQLTMGAAFTLPLAIMVDRPFALTLPLPVLGSWLALALLGTVVAYAIYYALIERTSATFVSTVTYIIPVFGLLLGAVILGETLHVTLLISLALILLSVGLVRR